MSTKRQYEHFIDYVNTHDGILMSPIWGGERIMHFCCAGHIEVSQALGFEIEQISDWLYVVKPGQFESREQYDKEIRPKLSKEPLFGNEINYLYSMLEYNKGTENLTGGGCFGPLTIAGNIIGVEKLLRYVVKKPDIVHELLEIVTNFLVDLATQEAELDQDFFWIAEPLASVVSPANFKKFSMPYLKRIFDAARAPGALHVCGQTIKHTLGLVESGAELLSIDYCTDVGECLDMVDDNIVIMGNISPMLLRDGTVEDVRKKTTEILESVGGRKNFIMSTGCAFIGETPEENMQAIFDVCREYGERR